MIVSKTSKIPDKEIYEVIGPVSVKVLEIEKGAREDLSKHILKRKVINMGGNALINFSVKREGLALKNIYSGLGVIVKDAKPWWETE